MGPGRVMNGGPYLKGLLCFEYVDTVFSSLIGQVFVRLKSLGNNYGIHESRTQEGTLICSVLPQGTCFLKDSSAVWPVHLVLSIG